MLKIKKEDICNMYYLSPVQNGMLFHYLLDSSSNAYFHHVTFELIGELDIDILKQSYNKLLNSHQALRTIFIYEKMKRPVQAVLKQVEQDIESRDISNFEKKVQAEIINNFMKEDREKGIQLDKEIPMRMTIFKTGVNSHKIIWDCHHIIIDGWSIGLVIKELFEIYEAILKSNEIVIEEVPYGKYLQWIENIDKTEANSYWTKTLDGFSECMEFPILTKKNSDIPNIKKYTIKVSSKDFKRIKQIAAMEKVTSNAVVQTLWGILVGKYNNTNDVVWGNVTAGRSADVDNIENIIGLFINTVPLRMKFDNSKTIREIFKSVNECMFKGEQYSYMQLADLQHLNSGSVTLFNHIVAYENIQMTDLIQDAKFGNFKLQDIEFFEPTNYDLAVKFEPSEDLLVNFEYNENVYSKDLIRNLGNSFTKLINTLISSPETPIGEIDVISDDEYFQVIEKFNEQYIDQKNIKTLQDIFKEQVEAFPNKTAVEYKNQKITYRQLDQNSDCIAKILFEKGIKPNDIIAIEACHQIEMVYGILGILKVGAAYLPLDTSYPKVRLKHMLEDCFVNTILYINKEADIPENYDLIDICNPNIYEENIKLNLNIEYSLEDVAYIIYTSGSTGNPKGVQIKQKSIVRLVKDLSVVHVGKEERVLQLASFAFDASVYEFFAPILNGGTVIMVSNSENTDTSTLSNFIKEKEISICFITTQLFNIVADFDMTCFEKVRKIFIGGEVVSVTHMKKALDTLGPGRIHNIYGPTETTVFACAYPINYIADDQISIPIGKPLPGLKFFVFDKNMNLSPIGTPGELYISGTGLAKGYLNNDELTQQKFVINPYNSEEILYRTGDIVKWTLDGNIEFVGRADNQIKIRGFRIEIGEITNHLISYPKMKEAVVVANREEIGGYKLCAYCVSDDIIDSSEIKEYLKDKLPEFMIPTYIIQIDKIPLNRNGKFDKDKVPKPTQIINQNREYCEPESENQKILAKVWEQILNTKTISIDDNFFYLGGDSIKAMQITAYLKKYNLNIEMKNIFKYPTIRQLSKYVFSEVEFKKNVEVYGNVLLNPVQHWFFEQNFQYISHFNQSVLLKGKKRLEVDLIEKTFDSITKTHDALRMIYKISPDGIQQEVRSSTEKGYQLSFIDYGDSDVLESDIEKACSELQSSLNIERAPLINIGLLRTKDSDYLLIVIHHLVVDGVSWRILLEDLITIYLSYEMGEIPHIVEERTSFKTYSEKLYGYSNEEKIEKDLEYWKAIQVEKLEKLRKDSSIEKRLVKDNHTYRISLPKYETKQLLSIRTKEQQADLNDILLASLGTAIKKWRNISNFAVNMESYGRDIDILGLDLSRTVGWFTAMYPFILNVNNSDNQLSYLEAVSKQMRDIKSSKVCYGIAKYLSNQRRDILHRITPEISLNYLGQFGHEIDNELFEMANINGGSNNNIDQHKCFALDINSAIVDNCLNINIDYNKNEFTDESIKEFADLYYKEIESFVETILREEIRSRSEIDYAVPFPLTSIQMAYLLGKQNIYERGGFTTHCYIEVETELDIDRFNITLNKLIKSQHMLRAIILPNGMQQILNNVPDYKIMIQDIREKSSKDQQSFIENERDHTSHSVFDITKWPLFEIKGVQITNEKKYLFISYDLLIMDSASANIFIQELMWLYDHPEEELPALEYTYQDFVSDLNTLKTGKMYEVSRSFWREKLATFPQAPNLNYKKLPSDASESKFRRLSNLISPYKWKNIKDYAHKNGTTPSAVLLTAYGEVLSYWSNQKQLAINLTVFNRYPFHRDINRIIGDFTSIVLIDIDKSKSNSFWVESRDVQTKLAEALEHRFYDGVEFTRDVAKKYDIPQGKAVMPIVFTSLLFENDIQKDIQRFGNVKWSIGQTPQVFIDLQAMEEEGKLKIYCDYVEDMFEIEVIEEMFNQYINILESIAEKGEVDNLVLSDNDRKLIDEYNQTDEIILPSTLHDLFRSQVLKTPDNIAVQSELGEMTYAELDRKSNQVANYLLKEKGLQNNQSVAIIAEREIASIVNILGVLKAGGKYVPINPEFPQKRKEFLIKDSECLCVMDTNTYNTENISSFSSSDIDIETDTESIAYIIYTSGSTGTPKGVIIKHGAVTNTIIDINQKIKLSEKDRIIGLSSMCFDLSVYDIFGVLSTGAALVMIKDQRDAGIIRLALEKYKITVWNSVPAIMEMLTDILPEDYENDTLREVLLSGDWIPLNLPGKISSKFTKASVTSLGGATEASIWSIYYPVKSVNEGWKSIPYGIPLANQKMYILNYDGTDCPIGVKGEIYISGVGVAEGYLNNRELTEKSFIMHETYGRIYKTGDFGVLHRDGYIEFLGRIDQQIKIRGYRVELGEIETTLREHDSVQEAVVNVCKANDNSQQLIGYIVAKNDDEINKKRDFVDEILLAGDLSSKKIPAHPNAEQYGDFMNELDNLSTVLIFEAVRSLGVHISKDIIVDVDKIVKEKEIKPSYGKLIRQWMNTIVEEGYAEKLLSGTYAGIREIPKYDTQKLWNNVENNPMLEYWKDVFNALKLCNSNQMNLLTGKRNAVEYLFPEGSWKQAESVYRYSPVAEYKNNIIRDVISSYIKSLPQGKKIRILEFGAGTGGTTSAILPILPKDRVAYTFTDLSSFFTNIARDIFKEYEFIQYDVYNIDEEPQSQGFKAHSYDIIVGANVLHDAKHLNRSLKHFNSLLTADGMLVILEITTNSRLIKASTGYLEGFCSYEDDRIQREKTLLTAEEWKSKFEESGFEESSYFPPAGSKAEAFREHIIMGINSKPVAAVSVDEIKEFMLQKLPEYMVPTRFMQIDSIPLTENGKVDRKNLPVPNLISANKKEIIEAKTETEKELVSVWKEVLGIDTLSINEDFFELGGDSLKAIKLISKMKQISQSIELADIYNYKNIQSIAKVIHKNRNKLQENKGRLILLRKGEEDKNIFFIHGGNGTSSIYLGICNNIDRRYNCWGMDIGKYIENSPSNLRVADIAEDYYHEILKIQSDGEYNLAGWCIGGSIAFEIANKLEKSERTVKNVFLLDSKEPNGTAQSFTFDTELDLLRTIASTELMEKLIEGANHDIEKLWENILSYLMKETAESLALRESVADKFEGLVSNIENLPLQQFIETVNVIRSLAYSRDEYWPIDAALSSDVTLIEAEDKSGIDKEVWCKLCKEKFNYVSVAGDHVTILNGCGAEECSNIINESLLN